MTQIRTDYASVKLRPIRVHPCSMSGAAHREGRKVSYELWFIDGNEKASVTDFFIPERKADHRRISAVWSQARCGED